MSFYGGINIKNYQKIFIFLGILLFILLSCFIVLPFLLAGPPTPLFYIDNNDPQSHELTVEVFDSHNESVFKDKYELAPKEHIEQPKSLWLLLQRSMPWPEQGEKGNYEFKVILDSNITDTCRTLPHPLTSVVIYVDEKNGSQSPMSMRVITV